MIEDNSPSEPILSPSNDKIAYISPYEWETISKLYLFNFNNGEKRVLIDPIDGKSIPKEVLWLNDSILAVIMGNGYGTVAVGGNAVLLDIKNNKLKYLTEYPSEFQATHISIVEKNVLKNKSVKYLDEEFINTSEFFDFIKITDLL